MYPKACLGCISVSPCWREGLLLPLRKLAIWQQPCLLLSGLKGLGGPLWWWADKGHGCFIVLLPLTFPLLTNGPPICIKGGKRREKLQYLTAVGCLSPNFSHRNLADQVPHILLTMRAHIISCNPSQRNTMQRGMGGVVCGLLVGPPCAPDAYPLWTEPAIWGKGAGSAFRVSPAAPWRRHAELQPPG